MTMASILQRVIEGRPTGRPITLSGQCTYKKSRLDYEAALRTAHEERLLTLSVAV